MAAGVSMFRFSSSYLLIVHGFDSRHGGLQRRQCGGCGSGPAVDASKAAKPGEESSVIAGGCFWGIQAVFQHVKGVISATSGYSGGEAKTAEYEIVSTGETGHAESVKITWDPSQITYGELLRVFFSVAHDPTELNHQGPDDGTQYRSVIFYANDGQKKIAEAYIAQLDKAKVFSRADRDPGSAAEGVLSGGGLSSELCDAASEPAVHCFQRRPEGGAFAAGVPGDLYRQVTDWGGMGAGGGQRIPHR